MAAENERPFEARGKTTKQESSLQHTAAPGYGAFLSGFIQTSLKDDLPLGTPSQNRDSYGCLTSLAKCTMTLLSHRSMFVCPSLFLFSLNFCLSLSLSKKIRFIFVLHTDR